MMMGISEDRVDYTDATSLKLETSRDGISSTSVSHLRPSELERYEVQHQAVNNNGHDHLSVSTKALPFNIAEVSETDRSCGFMGLM